MYNLTQTILQTDAISSHPCADRDVTRTAVDIQQSYIIIMNVLESWCCRGMRSTRGQLRGFSVPGTGWLSPSWASPRNQQELANSLVRGTTQSPAIRHGADNAQSVDIVWLISEKALW